MSPLDTLGWRLITILNSDRDAEILIVGDRIELSDASPFAGTAGHGRDIDATGAAYQKVGGAVPEPVANEMVLISNLDRQHAIWVGDGSRTMLSTKRALTSPNFNLPRVNLAFQNDANIAAMAATGVFQSSFPDQRLAPLSITDRGNTRLTNDERAMRSSLSLTQRLSSLRVHAC